MVLKKHFKNYWCLGRPQVLKFNFFTFFTFSHSSFSPPLMKQNKIIMIKKKLHEFPYKLPNDLRLKDLRKLGNFNKIPEMLGSDDEYLTGHPKGKF